MKNITKNLMSVTLGAAIIAGALGFCSTIEASPHKNIVHLDDREQRPPEPPHQRDHNHHHQTQDDHRRPEHPPENVHHHRPEHPPQYTLRYDHGRLERIPQYNPDRPEYPMMHQ